MSLKTIVKVDSITNLSDARYCAGMGVDLVGFNTVPTRENYLNPTMFQEIRGWITGPSIVAELYQVISTAASVEIIAQYVPDYLELAVDDLRFLPADNTLPLLVSCRADTQLQDLERFKSTLAFILLAEADKALAEKFTADYKILIKLQSTTALQAMVDDPAIAGVTLSGSPELRPGYKEYGDLADVLEQLDID